MRLAIGGFLVATIVCVAGLSSVLAQPGRPRRPAPTVEGTVTVNVSDQEHILPILCYERERPTRGRPETDRKRVSPRRCAAHRPLKQARQY